MSARTGRTIDREKGGVMYRVIRAILVLVGVASALAEVSSPVQAQDRVLRFALTPSEETTEQHRSADHQRSAPAAQERHKE